MSGLANPRKNFRYLLELDGLNSFLVQEVDPPEVEYEEIAHGAPVNIPNAKTPGKLAVGDLVLRKLKPALQADTWAWDWFGNGLQGVKSDFVKVGRLKDLGPDGLLTVETFFLGDIWPKKISDSSRNSMGPGENLIQEVTFSCQFYFNENSPILAALLAGGGALAGGQAFNLGFNEGGT